MIVELESVLSGFSEATKPFVRNVVDFFESSQEEQKSRIEYLSSIKPSSRLAAVLVLLFEKDNHLRVLVTVRGKNLRTHGGQTSLPGGKMEEMDGGDILTTAYREAHEEVGLPLNHPTVHTLGILELQPFYTLVVAPVVAILTDLTMIDGLKARSGEVDLIYSHPLEGFLDPSVASRLEDLVPHGSDDWSYELEYHSHQDYMVEALDNMKYRLHRFRTSAAPITGLTADVLINVSQIAYRKEPTYERFADGQLRSFDGLVKAFEKLRLESKEAKPIVWRAT